MKPINPETLPTLTPEQRKRVGIIGTECLRLLEQEEPILAMHICVALKELIEERFFAYWGTSTSDKISALD